METVVSGLKFVNEVKNAIGLGGQVLTNLSISMPLNGLVTVHAEMLVIDAQSEKLVEIFKSYELHERKSEGEEDEKE